VDFFTSLAIRTILLVSDDTQAQQISDLVEHGETDASLAIHQARHGGVIQPDRLCYGVTGHAAFVDCPFEIVANHVCIISKYVPVCQVI
jgi:hypothetical protein